MGSTGSDKISLIAIECLGNNQASSTPQLSLSDTDITPKGCGFAASGHRRNRKPRQVSSLVKAANWLFGYGSSYKVGTKSTQRIVSTNHREVSHRQFDKDGSVDFETKKSEVVDKTNCDSYVWQTECLKYTEYEDAHLSIRERLRCTRLASVLGVGLESIFNVSCFLSRAATDYPAAPCPVAVVDVQTSMERSPNPVTFSYPHLATCSALVAQCLRRDFNVRPGNVVAVLMRNSHEVMVLHYACAAIGAQLLNLNTQLVAKEMALILAESGAITIVGNPLTHTDVLQETLQDDQLKMYTLPLVSINCMSYGSITDYADQMRGWIRRGFKLRWTEILAFSDAHVNISSKSVSLEMSAHIYYTSGTSGNPKGVNLTHAVVARHAVATCAEMLLNNNDIWLHIAPMFHLVDAFAIYGVTLVGGRHIIAERFEVSNALCTIEREGVTSTNMASTMVAIICTNSSTHHFDLSSLRVLSCGGCPLAPASVTRAFSIFGCEFFISYGMTECCGKIIS